MAGCQDYLTLTVKTLDALVRAGQRPTIRTPTRHGGQGAFGAARKKRVETGRSIRCWVEESPPEGRYGNEPDAVQGLRWNT